MTKLRQLLFSSFLCSSVIFAANIESLSLNLIAKACAELDAAYIQNHDKAGASAGAKDLILSHNSTILRARSALCFRFLASFFSVK